MDQRSENENDLALELCQIAYEALPTSLIQNSEVFRFLKLEASFKEKKLLKFMTRQDLLAVSLAKLCLQNISLSEEELKSRIGLFLCVGHIPFEQEPVESITQNSEQEGKFSAYQFATQALPQVSPLLTFKCLPNMPLFHVSFQLGIQGPYFVSYPGLAQFYQVLQQAQLYLHSHQIDYALVGAISEQNNYLFKLLCKKMNRPIEELQDQGVFLCLKRKTKNSRVTLQQLEMGFEIERNTEEYKKNFIPQSFHFFKNLKKSFLGSTEAELKHEWISSEGIKGYSQWQIKNE